MSMNRRTLFIAAALSCGAAGQHPDDAWLVLDSRAKCEGRASWNEEGSKTLKIEHDCPITLEQCLTEAWVHTADGKVRVVFGCGTSRDTGVWSVDFEGE